MNTTFAWSYSYLTAFETCPRRFNFTKVTKEVVEPQTEALMHGNEVHKALENAVAKSQPLPEKYSQYTDIVNKVIRTEGVKHAEMRFGLTQQLTPTGFFAKDVWLRGVFDLAIVRKDHAVILDWKTGKPKSEPDQLKLFAAAALAIMPRVESVRTGFVWLAYNKLDSDTYQRDDAQDLWDEFKPRVARIRLALETNNFPPRPSGLCNKWCPVPKRLCEFSGKS
jgi:CRISPR/Cas system-associated exonuclease Cas4 (RecB family)